MILFLNCALLSVLAVDCSVSEECQVDEMASLQYVADGELDVGDDLAMGDDEGYSDAASEGTVVKAATTVEENATEAETTLEEIEAQAKAAVKEEAARAEAAVEENETKEDDGGLLHLAAGPELDELTLANVAPVATAELQVDGVRTGDRYRVIGTANSTYSAPWDGENGNYWTFLDWANFLGSNTSSAQITRHVFNVIRSSDSLSGSILSRIQTSGNFTYGNSSVIGVSTTVRSRLQRLGSYVGIDMLNPATLFFVVIPLMGMICLFTAAAIGLSADEGCGPRRYRRQGGASTASPPDTSSCDDFSADWSEAGNRPSNRPASRFQRVDKLVSIGSVGSTSSTQQCKVTLCGPQPILCKPQCMAQSVFGPRAHPGSEPIATLLFMEQGTMNQAPWDPKMLAAIGADAIDANGMPSSRIVLKHGGTTVAVLDTTHACMDPGRKECTLFLCDDEGNLQRPGFAVMRPTAQEGRFVVSSLEGNQLLLLADMSRNDGKQGVTLSDPNGHVVAYMEGNLQHSQMGVTYYGSFNTVVVDCSLVMLSWTAAIKLSDSLPM